MSRKRFNPGDRVRINTTFWDYWAWNEEGTVVEGPRPARGGYAWITYQPRENFNQRTYELRYQYFERAFPPSETHGRQIT